MTAALSRRAATAVPLLLLAAGFLLPWGLWLGLVPAGNCGSPWFPNGKEAEVQQLTAAMSGLPDTFRQDCEDRWGNDGAVGGVLAGFAGACVLTAVVVWSQGRRDDVS